MRIGYKPGSCGNRIENHHPIVVIRVAGVFIVQGIGDGLARIDLPRWIVGLRQGNGSRGAGAPGRAVEITPNIMAALIAVVSGDFDGDLLARVLAEVEGIRCPGKNPPIRAVSGVDLTTVGTRPGRSLGVIAISPRVVTHQSV